jgi:hypothetical protein
MPAAGLLEKPLFAPCVTSITGAARISDTLIITGEMGAPERARIDMATYDPPQPLWKRNVAGILDFLLAVIVLGYPLSKLPGSQSPNPPSFGPGTQTVELVGLSGWPALLLLALVIAYFVVLGRTGARCSNRCSA